MRPLGQNLMIVGSVRDSDGDLKDAVAQFQMYAAWLPMAPNITLTGSVPEQIFELQFDDPDGRSRRIVLPNIEAQLSNLRRHWFMLGAVTPLIAAVILIAVLISVGII